MFVGHAPQPVGSLGGRGRLGQREAGDEARTSVWGAEASARTGSPRGGTGLGRVGLCVPAGVRCGPGLGGAPRPRGVPRPSCTEERRVGRRSSVSHWSVQRPRTLRYRARTHVVRTDAARESRTLSSGSVSETRARCHAEGASQPGQVSAAQWPPGTRGSHLGHAGPGGWERRPPALVCGWPLWCSDTAARMEG